jgi:hypothetical protein
VTTVAVVERLDVLEDRGAELAPGRPGAPMDELLLQRGKEALGDGVDAPIVVKSAFDVACWAPVLV